jgi:hypothetical protein
MNQVFEDFVVVAMRDGLLAYCVATRLPRGMLIYAAGVAEPVTHCVPLLDKVLEVVTLDLSVPPAEILAQVARLCQRVRKWRRQQVSHI